MDSDRLDPWIDGYLSYLAEVRRIKPRTVVDHKCTFRRVVRMMASIRPEEPLWKLSLDDYLKWISEEREQGQSTNSIAKEISHLRGLLNYAWRSGRSDRNVLDGFQLADANRKVEPRALSLEEAKRLVLSCLKGNRKERRDRMVVLLLYGCGLRTSELRQLNVEDIDLERKEIFIRHGKGDRERQLPVSDGLWTELLAFLAERGGKRGALFRTLIRRARMSDAEICQVVSDAARKAGVEGEVTPKTLRHTFGTHLMDRGVNLAAISLLMGHRGPAETGVYLHALPGRRESAVDKLGSMKKEDRR